MASTDFTIADVLAWARTKPADEVYVYTDSTNCALCQFLRETGRVLKPCLGGNTTGLGATLLDRDNWRKVGIVPAEICEVVNPGRGSSDWVFGKLVARLEALCPDTPVTSENWAAIDAYLTDIEAVEA